jgi:3-oxoacyl-[acyl-carrier-protein] synthase II
MSSIKSLTGHSLGAASALEAVACILALQHQTLPATWNFRALDPECAWDIVPNAPRPSRVDLVLNNAYAFGGNNASVLLRHPRQVESL